jgi:hypothetical protein
MGEVYHLTLFACGSRNLSGMSIKAIKGKTVFTPPGRAPIKTSKVLEGAFEEATSKRRSCPDGWFITNKSFSKSPNNKICVSTLGKAHSLFSVACMNSEVEDNPGFFAWIHERLQKGEILPQDPFSDGTRTIKAVRIIDGEEIGLGLYLVGDYATERHHLPTKRISIMVMRRSEKGPEHQDEWFDKKILLFLSNFGSVSDIIRSLLYAFSGDMEKQPCATT